MNSIWVRAVGVLLIVVTLIGGTLIIKDSFDANNFSRCQAEVLDDLIGSWKAREELTEQERRSLNLLFTELAKSSKPADTSAAVARFNAAVSLTDAARREQPIPEPPSKVCR